MFTGKQFKLNRATMAIETLDGRSVAVIVPADMTVSVLSAPTNTGAMIDVLWEKRHLVMFAIDVNERGTEVNGKADPPLGAA